MINQGLVTYPFQVLNKTPQINYYLYPRINDFTLVSIVPNFF